MLIPKCCLNCSNKNKGTCCCTLPSLCNEYVEDNTIINKQATVITNYSLSSEHGLVLKTEQDVRADERKHLCDKIYKALTSENGWHRMKNWWCHNGKCEELREFLDQIQGECDG